jgi:hypothetical protein
MNTKLRYLYLIIGAAGLVLLFYYIFSNLSDLSEIDPVHILFIAVPDLVFFFLAYKTYPPEPDSRRQQSYQQRKVSNY